MSSSDGSVFAGGTVTNHTPSLRETGGGGVKMSTTPSADARSAKAICRATM